MSKDEKIILILAIVIIVLLFMNIFKFFNKNKGLFGNLKNKKTNYEAIVINKRQYNDNNRDLYYVTFYFDENEREFLVDKFIYNEIAINQKGILILKYNYFLDFK